MSGATVLQVVSPGTGGRGAWICMYVHNAGFEVDRKRGEGGYVSVFRGCKYKNREVEAEPCRRQSPLRCAGVKQAAQQSGGIAKGNQG
jgi:hypothetical protein